jgi:hypothetical protein
LGSEAQPLYAHKEILGCTSEGTSVLNTVTMETDVATVGRFKLLIDTGTDVSLLKYNRIKEGTVYDPVSTLNVKGISSETERTLGELQVKLIVGNYETEHTFHVVGDGVNIPYDGLIG